MTLISVLRCGVSRTPKVFSSFSSLSRTYRLLSSSNGIHRTSRLPPIYGPKNWFHARGFVTKRNDSEDPSEILEDEELPKTNVDVTSLRFRQKEALDSAAKVFDQIDRDKDGKISKDEIDMLTRRLTREHSTRIAYSVSEKLQKLRTRCGGELERDIFVAWWLDKVDVFGMPYDPANQRPPSIIRRTIAGMYDMGYCYIPPVILATFGLPPEYVAFALVGASFMFIFRDTLTTEGRSPGKKFLGLEIVQCERGLIEGTEIEGFCPTCIPASRGMALWRNLYGLLRWLPLVGPWISFGDLSLIIFSKHRRTIGDHLAHTMVVPEGPKIHSRLEKSASKRLVRDLTSKLIAKRFIPKESTVRKYPHPSHYLLLPILFITSFGILMSTEDGRKAYRKAYKDITTKQNMFVEAMKKRNKPKKDD
ncbi:hypothetical protein AAMO2058_000347100 [Amorphochlora amoebiformis]